MARMKNIMQMTGSMANVSMYNMQGHDEVIVRMKGGPSKRQIKTKPQFEAVRRNNSEWAGCTKMGSQIRMAFKELNRLEDYPVTGALNAICKAVQKEDTTSEHGKRGIFLSQHKQVLLGFSFSRKQVLESVLRASFETSLNRETCQATIHIPDLNTDMYLYNFRKLPYYRIVATFSGVCDTTMSETEKCYEYPTYNNCDKMNGIFNSEWLPAIGMQPAMDIKLLYPNDILPLPKDVTLLLCMGIEFGKMGIMGIPEPVKYSGTGKIVKVG